MDGSLRFRVSKGNTKTYANGPQSTNHLFRIVDVLPGHKIPIKSKINAIGIATKINTKQAIIIFRTALSILTPGLSSRSIFICIVSTKIRKNETAFATLDKFFD